MLISRVAPGYDAYAKPAPARKPAKERDGAEKDVVTTSPAAKEYQYVRQALANVPEIREDKVAAVKRRLESGTYAVPSSEVAERFAAYIAGGERLA
jgi:negative regulator of flagellin synthesis FlgM